MIKAHATRETWRPKSAEEQAAILRELDAILASPQFRNSKRYPALLEYVVKSTLAGRSDQLRERTLGVEVFDRSPSYDTNADTIVRYTAGEVRKRLLLYYSDGGGKSNLRISLPAGSYVPEFAYDREEPGTAAQTDRAADGGNEAPAHKAVTGSHAAEQLPERPQAASEQTSVKAGPSASSRSKFRSRGLWIAAAAVLVLAAVAGGLLWRSRALHPAAAVDQFWAPLLQDRHNVVLCTGSVIFAQDNSYGAHMAGKGTDYSFVSMQIASAIAQVSDMTERSGRSTQLAPSASTPLADLREHPVILLGGYNNQWTLRLLDPLRFHFAPNPNRNVDLDAILDRMQPMAQWRRDPSFSYGSADDYAVVARFRDATIDGWVVALAGLGRNGTEAAAQFAISPQFMDRLRDRIGRGFEDKNIEVVLKVSVNEGKSGPPSILAVYSW